jgi:VIT1/CCC1 family predicted Fe2+/Mn2+ transporter
VRRAVTVFGLMSRNAWIVTAVAVILATLLAFGIVRAVSSMRELFDEDIEATGLVTHVLLM